VAREPPPPGRVNRYRAAHHCSLSGKGPQAVATTPRAAPLNLQNLSPSPNALLLRPITRRRGVRSERQSRFDAERAVKFWRSKTLSFS